MKIDSVKRYLQLRTALTQEKEALEKRLAYLTHALSETGAAPAAKANADAPRKSSRSRRRRASNELSLTEAIRQATASRPLTKKEIYQSVLKQGYKFTTAKPLNSINAKLYAKGMFKNQKGRFSPAS